MKPQTPLLTVDIIIEVEQDIVIIERKNPPYGFAFPGGFVDIGESVEQAAIREAKEETNLEVELIDLLYVYSNPKRDPRGHAVSVVFVAKGEGKLKAQDDAKKALLVNPREKHDFVFDHAEILKDYLTYKETGQKPSPSDKL
ncbi:MAG: NUDIX hydrolase [Candidatus Hydrogenedentota bacterium]|nr:MAG: NUDIX hydrolase [Candidatus Hydrogenedentota bacterium]